MERPYKVIAVDFDGTLCENAWPEIGEPRKAVIDYVLAQKEQGAKLILWTNRSGEPLENAIRWCEDRGIVFDTVNENLPEIIEYFGNDCRKVFADEYIDDRMIPMPGEVSALVAELGRDFARIRDRLGENELLAQLAEESAELAKAALKYRRALDGNNPTPMSKAEAAALMVEEIADVESCVLLLTSPADTEAKENIIRYKISRWLNRLEDRTEQAREVPYAR